MRASLALVFATIERPQVVQRLIGSARRFFPAMPIYVADQSLDVTPMLSFYESTGTQLIRMPYDAGVCASRNRLALAVKEEYLVLCDDDFVLGAETDFAPALEILAARPDIGIVGGRLYDFDGEREFPRHWELYLHLDRANRTLTSIPITQFAPRVERLGALSYYLCDAVMNFAVMRRTIFEDPCVRWDERFQSNGEHEDFYLNLKLHSNVRVAYLPRLIAYHHHPESFLGYRSRLRDRVAGWARFFEKWQIDQHLEIGMGVRTIRDLSTVVTQEDTERRFYLNPNLTLRRTEPAEVLVVGSGGALHCVSGADEHGEPRWNRTSTARLLVPRDRGRPLPVRPADAEHNAQQSASVARARHSFGPDGPFVEPDHLRFGICFRYNAALRANADFLLWYRMIPVPMDAAAKAASLQVRWFNDDGAVLLWESRMLPIDLRRDDYWVPLLLETPMRPRRCRYVRFEVVIRGVQSSVLLARGFVDNTKRIAPRADGTEPPPVLIDCTALNVWRAGLDSAPAPANLASMRFQDADATLKFIVHPSAPSLALLSVAELVAFDVLFVLSPAGGQAPLAALRRTELQRPGAAPYVALPVEDLAGTRFVGFLSGRGYRQVQLQPSAAALSAMPVVH